MVTLFGPIITPRRDSPIRGIRFIHASYSCCLVYAFDRDQAVTHGFKLVYAALLPMTWGPTGASDCRYVE